MNKFQYFSRWRFSFALYDNDIDDEHKRDEYIEIVYMTGMILLDISQNEPKKEEKTVSRSRRNPFCPNPKYWVIRP